jgi:hypothetical protein
MVEVAKIQIPPFFAIQYHRLPKISLPMAIISVGKISVLSLQYLSHSFVYSLMRQLLIWEGNIPFESQKCPL